jgi:60 kDa SS-A/Ro ribonucleoprotein
MSRHAKLHQLLPTGQQAPLAGATTPQVRNSAGGYVWKVSARQRLERFLILGSTSGSYYASPKALTVENLGDLEAMVAADGVGVVRTATAVSTAGRAPRQDPALLTLALCLKTGDLATRQAAAEAVQQVCRTGTHLFQLAGFIQQFGGWGRMTRRAIGAWYADKGWDQLGLQAVKYQQREGWSHRDLLRLCHVRPPTPGHGELFRWMTQGFPEGVPANDPSPALRLPWAMASAHAAKADPTQVAALVRAHALPRECLPGEALQHPGVWSALLHTPGAMGLTALLRNLGKMTEVGLFARDRGAVDAACAALTSPGALRAGRVHPLSVLVALNTYRRGQGVRGSLRWTPVPALIGALEQAFHASFASITPAGTRHLLAVDVSGSMGCGEIAGMTGVTPRVGAAAMALTTLRTEPEAQVMAFSDSLVRVPLSRRATLEDVHRALDPIPMGGTDCALPMEHARQKRIPVDTFVVYTDNETWHGKVHPAAALRAYRDAMGIPAKLIVVGMVSNRFTIADPDDAGMLDVVGFDTSAPAVMADFARGR